MTYDIQSFGARADGTLCTKSIQDAIDACFLGGGGEVTVPQGTFLTGGLRLRSGVTLHLLENAVLLGSIDPEDYCTYLQDKIEPISEEERCAIAPNVADAERSGRSAYPYSRWNNAIIRAIHAENIAIIGEKGSKINGQNCYDPQGEEKYRGPHAINMWYCKNVTLEGYTIVDSANWAHAIQNSENITARRLTVLGGHDGFDVRTCDNVLIEDSRFLTGDDGLAGYDNRDVTVRNCYYESSCSVFRFGGTRVLIENCESRPSATYAFRGSLSDEEKQNRAMAEIGKHRDLCKSLFLYYCDMRAIIRETPGDILIKNCRFGKSGKILHLPFGHIWCCNRSLDNITFENCSFEDILDPIVLESPEEEPFSLVAMKNCTIKAREGAEDHPFLAGKNVKKLLLENVKVEGFDVKNAVCDPSAEIEIR